MIAGTGVLSDDGGLKMSAHILSPSLSGTAKSFSKIMSSGKGRRPGAFVHPACSTRVDGLNSCQRVLKSLFACLYSTLMSPKEAMAQLSLKVVLALSVNCDDAQSY